MADVNLWRNETTRVGQALRDAGAQCSDLVFEARHPRPQHAVLLIPREVKLLLDNT